MASEEELELWLNHIKGELASCHLNIDALLELKQIEQSLLPLILSRYEQSEQPGQHMRAVCTDAFAAATALQHIRQWLLQQRRSYNFDASAIPRVPTADQSPSPTPSSSSESDQVSTPNLSPVVQSPEITINTNGNNLIGSAQNVLENGDPFYTETLTVFNATEPSIDRLSPLSRGLGLQCNTENPTYNETECDESSIGNFSELIDDFLPSDIETERPEPVQNLAIISILDDLNINGHRSSAFQQTEPLQSDDSDRNSPFRPTDGSCSNVDSLIRQLNGTSSSTDNSPPSLIEHEQSQSMKFGDVSSFGTVFAPEVDVASASNTVTKSASHVQQPPFTIIPYAPSFRMPPPISPSPLSLPPAKSTMCTGGNPRERDGSRTMRIHPIPPSKELAFNNADDQGLE